MNILVIQIIIGFAAAAAVVAATRKFLRRELPLGATALWVALWAAIVVATLLPRTTELLARLLGVGRGVDAALYLAVVALFWMQFRALGRLERIERDITALARAAALRDLGKEEGGKGKEGNV